MLQTLNKHSLTLKLVLHSFGAQQRYLAGSERVGIQNLKTSLPATPDTAELGWLAEKIAAGDVEAIRAGIPALARIDPSGSIVHAALMQGFGWVMLYGGIGVWWPRHSAS
ncbi:hypothetical protein [Paraburkholderia ultramafica]|uniref:hypothetical protein n=1 Tax=Paraburkholderia ultramafica TaxID=1544867 RepID=UPI001FE886DD|nr:hypothetical protein [Paraburkholderia ultramafica]